MKYLFLFLFLTSCATVNNRAFNNDRADAKVKAVKEYKKYSKKCN